MFSLFSPPIHHTLPTPLILITMSSSPMTSASAISPSSENLTNIKGLSSWELLQNHYQHIGSVHKYDYFPSVSFPFIVVFTFLIVLFFSSILHWLLASMLCVEILLLLMMR